MAFGGMHTAFGAERVVAFKGGLSRPRSHHKRVVVFMAGLAAGHTPTTSGHEGIGSSGGLQGPVQPATQPPQASGLLWLAWRPATQSPHTAYAYAYALSLPCIPFPEAMDRDHR